MSAPRAASITNGGLWLALRRLCSAGRQRAGFEPWATTLPPLPPRRPAAQSLTLLFQEAITSVGGGSAAAAAQIGFETAHGKCGSSPEPVVAAGVYVGRATVIAAATQAAAKAEARAENMKLQVLESEAAEMWRRRGAAIRAKRESCDEVFVELPDPSKDLVENEELCFKRAEKHEKTRARCAPLISTAIAEARSWRDAVGALPEADASATSADVEALHLRLREAGLIKEPKLQSVADPAVLLRRKYGKEIDCFLSPSGYEVVVGRSAGANERLSFDLAWKDGFWFHADSGVAGSHVAILCHAEEVAFLDDVEFAASIAAWHSKARNETNAAVCYCYAGQLSRPMVPKLGQVRILGPRGQLHVTPSPPPC